MINLFLKSTDKFLYESVKLVFHKTESKLRNQYSQERLLQELEKFQANPLGCTIGVGSRFEKNIKVKIKLIMGFCFVFVPLTIFSFFSYLTNIDITFAFFATLAVTLLVSSRIEEIAKKYVHSRKIKLLS